MRLSEKNRQRGRLIELIAILDIDGDESMILQNNLLKYFIYTPI